MIVIAARNGQSNYKGRKKGKSKKHQLASCFCLRLFAVELRG
jgi:hypothetical protein